MKLVNQMAILKTMKIAKHLSAKMFNTLQILERIELVHLIYLTAILKRTALEMKLHQ